VLKAIRGRLNYANVMSSIAVLMALGGGAAYAGSQIGSRDIENGTIRTVDLSFGLAGKGAEAEDPMKLGTGFQTILTRTVTTRHKGNLFVGGEIETTNPDVKDGETTIRVRIDGTPDDEMFTNTILAGTTDSNPAWLLCEDLTACTHTVELQARVGAGPADVEVTDRTLFTGVLPG
jgi:hypothetical protein